MFGQLGLPHRNGPRFAPGQYPAQSNDLWLNHIQAQARGRHQQVKLTVTPIQNVKVVLLPDQVLLHEHDTREI